MRKFIIATLLSALIISAGAIAQAKDYTFSPNPSNLWNLDHGQYYTWGFNFKLPKGQTITDAVLTINSIDNWANEKDNELYIHLLDNPKIGTFAHNDTTNGDQFKKQGKVVGIFHDTKAGKTDTLTYDFKALGLLTTLNTYLKNGTVGFGFDPDCHYYNKGISFKIETAPVPEPSSLLALVGGLSMGGFSLLRRRK